MRDKFEIDDIGFEKYNPSDLVHNELIIKLAKPDNSENYFENWQEMLKESLEYEQNEDTLAYIVRLDDRPIGILTVSFNMDNSAIIYQKLLPKYFNELASVVRDVMIDELANYNIDRVATIIDENDDIAKNVLLNSGYTTESFTNMGDTGYIQVTLYDKENNKNK